MVKKLTWTCLHLPPGIEHNYRETSPCQDYRLSLLKWEEFGRQAPQGRASKWKSIQKFDYLCTPGTCSKEILVLNFFFFFWLQLTMQAVLKHGVEKFLGNSSILMQKKKGGEGGRILNS